MKINLKTFIAVLFSLFLFSQCMIVSGIGSILQSDGKKSDSSLLGLLALAGGSGSGTNTNGETAPPTVQYSVSPFTFTKDVAIAILTPTITNTPFTNCASSPSLPTGLTLSTSNCAISGTPTIVSPATVYTITASNSFGTGNTTLSIQVMASGIAPTLSYSGSPFTFSQSSAISTLTPTLGGGAPTSCSSSPALPAGLSINATSCAISGTPTGTQASTSHTITAMNAYGNGTVNISITVNTSGTAPTISYSGSPYTYTQNSAIATLAPTLGGSAPTGCTSSPTLPTGLSINAATCAISGTPTGTQGVTNHTITATNAFGNGSTTINIRVNTAGTAPTVSYSGSPFTYTQNSAITTLTPTLGGSAVTGCTSSPTLPTGLSINATSCAISGTPSGTQASTAHTITATNGFGNGTASINITVNSAGTAPTVSYSGSPFTYVNGTAIATLSPALSGNTPTACSASPALPTGLSINATSCAISGTPTTNQGATIHTITATNAFGNGTANIHIAVTAGGVKVWTRLLGVASKSTIPSSITSDSNGNLYITGYTNGHLDGQIKTGDDDLLVVKYNSSGVKQWTQLLGAVSSRTYSNGITSDSSGNLYITGYTNGNLDGQIKTGTNDIFIVKYNSSGVKQWTRLLGVLGANAISNGITSDSTGYLYITGYTQGNLDGQIKTGTQDLFVVKYDSSGVKQWTRLLGGNESIILAQGITSDSNGYLYITGYTQGNLDGQIKTGTQDLFVVKYDSSGIKQWTRLLGVASRTVDSRSIISDSNGNVYATGYTNGNLDGQTLTGFIGLFIVKYDSSGIKQWTRLLSIAMSGAEGYGITSDSIGNVYATGYTEGNLDGQTKTGIKDLFVVKYDSSGIKQWTRLLGVASSNTNATCITSDSYGNLYSSGNTGGNLDGQTVTGLHDLFVVKYK